MIIRFRGATQQISQDMLALGRHAAFDVAQHRGLQRRTCGGERRPSPFQGRRARRKTLADRDGGAFIQQRRDQIRSAGGDVPERLEAAILRCLEKEPERRYQQASQVKTDVETISNSTAGRQGESSQAEAASALAGTRSAAEEESARQQVKWPAVGLLVTGVASWLLLPLVLYRRA